MASREFEVRFLEIDKSSLMEKLRRIKAKDLGEELFREIIFYDRDLKWQTEGKMVRLRQGRGKILMTYKHSRNKLGETTEAETTVGDLNKTREILENLGLTAFRTQEKKRHTFLFDSVTVDIDEHPKVPPYVEIEGANETVLRDAARALELDWKDAHFESSREFIPKIYHIPLLDLHFYTFDKME